MTVSQRRSVSSGALVAEWSARPIRSDAPAEQVIGAEFGAQCIEPDLVWVGVRGEIDIRNAHFLRDFVCRRLRESRRLVLDLTGVEFFGAVGLAVFDDLDEHARSTGARWVLVSGRPVRRLLRVADSAVGARTYSELDSALASLRSVA